MPLNDLYTYEIVQSEAECIFAKISFDSSHAVYKGHFPDQPVTPGVVLIEITRNVLANMLQKSLQLVSAKELKFLNPIIPSTNNIVDLKIDFTLTDGAYKVQAIYTADDKTFTKIKGVFRAT